MPDFELVDPAGWQWDLQSIYSAYMGHFQLHNIPWWDRSWAHFFASFDDFLQFGWDVITVTDSSKRTAHIVTRNQDIQAFLKALKTRFGETFSPPDNMLRIMPFETHQRPKRTISDASSYRKLHGTLRATLLAAQKVRVRSGDAKAIQELWQDRDKTFLAVDFEWSERNASSCLEWGYAAVRCGHLQAVGNWPPLPLDNFRKGHYVVEEYADKMINKHKPNLPWNYAWGESHVIPKAKLGQIVQAIVTSLASPESETQSNAMVLVAHGIVGDLERLADLKIKLPSNVFIIDLATYERNLFATGLRGMMPDPLTHKPRVPGSTFSLFNIARSLGINVDSLCVPNNSGNDAFITLLSLQKILEPDTKIPLSPVRSTRLTMPHTIRASSSTHLPFIGQSPMGFVAPPFLNLPASSSPWSTPPSPGRPLSAAAHSPGPRVDPLFPTNSNPPNTLSKKRSMIELHGGDATEAMASLSLQDPTRRSPAQQVKR